ncbi:hypothetical protein OSCT_2188 [Oscillochloris trichoides DG-6]|uniref:Core-binding (CB) domain-containing protein n=1 Tax=Oscillochloris trichoides DG-6 TaxID=765420 RepID=E1IFT7_9CHLR|nr:hypothetical protein [Oscillochloris trichoides]EFO79978.1 hypothetical protein OSCT_2188 [Oscillochloris trichoides DG-6]
MANQEPTIANILRQLTHEYVGSVHERQLFDHVLQYRPSSAKNPYATIRERLRWEGLSLGWLRLSRTHLMPLRVLLQDLQFRCLPRLADITTGRLPLAHFLPFAGTQGAWFDLVDEAGTSFPLIYPDQNDPDDESLPGFDLRGWFAHTGFAEGDSILVQITHLTEKGPILRVGYEPQTLRQPTPEQDRALIEALVERVNQTQDGLVACEDVILPIFAQAPWRTSYPGTPWQHLVIRDARVQLVDDSLLTNQYNFALNFIPSAIEEVFESQSIPEGERIAADNALLAEIEALQRDLRRSREEDADAGLWNGQILRASTAYSTLDSDLDQLFTRHNSLSAIEGYDEFDADDDEDDDDLFGFNQIDSDDLVLFENDEFARLQAAHRELIEALPPGVADQIEAARPEEAEVILAQHLNMLLAKKPHLFPPLDLSMNPDEMGIEPPTESLFDADAWQEQAEDDEDDDWEDEVDDLFAVDDDAARFYDESSDLISQFYDYLLESGKRSTTAHDHSHNVVIYAEFLALYYQRSLIHGDYASLDECLFYHYPRRILNTTPRHVREICTSMKQFYAFLKDRGIIADDRFAYAIWRRRDQAARVLSIYDRLAADSPNFDALFTRLFQPYTE